MKETVVYRHPKGRFEVIEHTGRGMLGGTYRYRETFLTPEKDWRGVLNDNGERSGK